MSTNTRLITADELLAMPHRDGRSDSRLELIRGELKKMSPTGVTHGILCARLAAALNNFVEENDLGVVCGAETGFWIEKDPDTVIGADVAYISHARLGAAENLDKFFPLAPDLAVEVLSPSNTAAEMKRKVDFYFAAGTHVVWIVDPEQKTVRTYFTAEESLVVGEGAVIDGGDILPGFSYEIDKLFKVAGRRSPGQSEQI
ncbi:MAG TPA: Uma2 family endonuclease [Pyrinomonadaceae bacterium]|nr:Uma2 family endonuclease [Pyrinomonadaceae bacterium]